MGKFDKLNKELVRVNNAQGGPNAAALDDRFQLLNNTLVNTQQEWEDYVARRQQEQEALDEYSHGRGNRSYLREDYGTGSYTEGMDAVKRRRQQQEWEKANADYEAALQEYNKAAETTRRVSAVAGPVGPEKQWEIDAAKSTEQSLKEQLDALKATADKLKVNDSGFTDWEGRDALVKEYRQLQTELEHQSRRSPERLARFDEVKRQLQEGDRAAGNKAADYSVRDRSASIFGGAAKRIAGGVANTALTAVDLMEKYSPYMDVAKAVNNRFGSMSPNPAQHRAGMDRLYAAADSISDSAAKDLDRAKAGLGKMGQAGVDIAENVLEMGFDAAVGALTGGGSLVSMFARVFGDSAREARQQGATLEQQVGYGVAAGGIEVLTEKLFDGVAGIYGKGAADNITETVIRRLSSTPTGQSLLRGLIGAINEGNEEVLSDLLNPLAQMIYRDDSLGQLYREVDPTEVLYDFLIGAAVGGLGSVTSAATGQNAARNAENEYITALYQQTGERPSFGREVRDRAILERQMTNPDAYNAANLSTEENAQEAMRALRGRQTESARAQELRQAQETIRQQDADSLVSTVFSGSGITLDENQRGRIMETLNDSKAGVKDFAIGTRDAYNMGEQGATMEETVQAIGEKYGLSPKQARTAWSFGASNAQTTATGTADIGTEEGRTKVESALSFLGDRTDEAVKLYDSRQDVGRMATAMNKAVLYAAHGADVQETVQNAREGKAADVVGVLTDEQAQFAQEIGAERRARQQAADKALGESYREMRKRAAAITGTTTVSAQALEGVDTAIDATRKAGQRVMDEFNTLYNALEALEKADPNAKNSEPYKEMLERAYKLRDKAQEAQKQIRELEKRKAQIEGRKTIQRKKGTVSFAGGTIEGVKYDGVDTAKLSRQQQKVVAMVERLADAVNLDYVFISADAGMGGAYTFGGRVYININAGLGVGDFSQTMAAASLSHEMTHWMQQYAPEEYSQLKDFVVQEILKADPQKLQKLIQQQKAWEKGRALTDEQALDEVVANACQTMLLDSKAINKLARQNMSLAARIADWIADWSQKVKDAFAEVDVSQGAIYEAVRALDGSLDRIQELWDNGIEAAAQSYNAQQTVEQANVAQEATNENAVQNIGDAQNQFIGESADTADKDALALARQLDKQGVDNESIRQQTGWFKGMDGTYKAGDEEDRLRKLNSVEGAQFQRWDDTDGDTAAEANGREEAYTRLQSENKAVEDTIAALRKLTEKQGSTIERLQKRLRLTTTPEVREADARKLARNLVKEYGSGADVSRISEQLKALGDYVAQTKDLNADEVKNRAREIARGIIESASEQVSFEDETLSRIRNSIKGNKDKNGKKLTISPDFLGELDQENGFDAFRKRNFGAFTLARADSTSIDRSEYTSVSQFYTDLQSEYGKAYFPDLSNEGEEIRTIASFARAAAPMEVNPFEQYMGEATEELANRISMEVMDGALRLTPATDADKAKTRREALQDRIRELQREGKVSEREAKDYERTIQELTDTLDKAQSRYRTLQVTAEQRMAQVRAEGRERAAEAMARERARGERKNQKLKEHYQEIMQAARERRQEAAGAGKYRKQIEKKAAKLYEMLAKNDDKLHVPEVLKQPLGEFLESLDFTSKRSLAGGEETQKDKTFALRLQKIQQILANQQDYINGGDMKQDLGGYIDVSEPNLDFLRRVSEMITTALSENRDFTINQMTAADLKDLSNFLSNLTTAIRNMNNFMANARFESVREAASQDIESIKALGKASETENGKLFSAAVWENGTPYYVFRRFGDGGKAIFDSFTRGWEKMAFNVQKVMDFTAETYSDKEVRDWQKERHEIELEGGSKITMTTGQIMSLSMLLNREQARKHMDKGGVRIGDIEGKKGAIKDTTHYHLTDTDVSNIIGQLTDRQAEVARKLQRFMAEQGAEWGNEISMRRFGYNFYTEGENYFPIKTDSADQPMSDTDAQQNSMFRLLNLSASKSLNPKASNALVVEDIFDVFADHMSDMAKLNGMGLPILDAIKWFNYKERIDLGDGQYDTRTMQAAMEQAFGDKALSYFRTLMKDINGVTESGDRGTDIFSKLMSNYKAASVAANLRVAFLQPTSYVRASYLIKPRFLMQAFTNHNAYKEAMENSGTAVWKSLGYYDTNIARGMREQIKHDDSWKDKAVEKSMKLAEIGDQRTWGRLWVACKMQTAAETGLQGEELKQKTADLFREVIYSSQVMDSTLTRSELMRGKTMYSKVMTSFMAEPTLSYNMVMDAGMEYHMNARKYGKAKAWQMSKGYIAKAFTVYACSATFSAVVESVFDALRDDDDDESFFDKWKQAMFGEGNLLTGNLAQDLTIIGKLPYLKSFVSTIQGYKSGDMSLAAFSTAIDAVKIWKETIDLATGALEKPTKTTYYGNMTTWGKIYKTMQAFSQFTGLAVANLFRDVFAVWNSTVGAFKPEWKMRTYESSGDRKRREAVKELTEQGVPKKLALQALQEPDADGNGSLKQDELGPWLNEKIESGELTSEQADAIWGTQGWKSSFSDYSAKAQKKAQATTQPATQPATQPETPAETPRPTAEKTQASPKPTPQASLSDFESFKKSVSLYGDKKEAAYRGWENEVKPLGVSLDSYVKIINAADAAGDGNGSVKQDEMGMQLVQKINRRELTYEQAEAIWHTIWNGARSKTFYKWYNG